MSYKACEFLAPGSLETIKKREHRETIKKGEHREGHLFMLKSFLKVTGLSS